MSGSTKVPSDGEATQSHPDEVAALAMGGTRGVSEESPGRQFALDAGSRSGPLRELSDALAASIFVDRLGGRRALDFGYGSRRVAALARERVAPPLRIVETGAGDRSVAELGQIPAESFDAVYSLWTFAHLGRDASSSEGLARSCLEELARVAAPGCELFLQIANLRSLAGFYAGLREPVTLVSRKELVRGGRYGLTRWDTLGRFMAYCPPSLELVAVHPIGVWTLHPRLLELPIVGRVLDSVEWRTLHWTPLAGLGRHLLLSLRRRPLP